MLKTYKFATGGMVAAPVVGKVVSRIGPLLDVAPLDEDGEAQPSASCSNRSALSWWTGCRVDEGSNYAVYESDRVR